MKNFFSAAAGALLCSLLAMPAALAGLPVVEAVEVIPLGGDRWRIDVTVSHEDTGWDHYANGWRVLDTQGEELGFRVLAHPHVKEQPFTRGLTLEIPPKVQSIRIQAIDLVHGPGEISSEVQLHR